MKQVSILDLIAESEALRDAGIEASVNAADRKIKKWSDRAVEVFISYISNLKPGTELKSEDVRIWSKLHDKIETPKSERSWGAVAQKVARLGYIRQKGYVKTVNPKAHRTPCALWEVI